MKKMPPFAGTTFTPENYREAAFYLVSYLFIAVDLVQTLAMQAATPGVTPARIFGFTALGFFILAPVIYRLTGRHVLSSLMVLVTASIAIVVSSLYNGGAPAPTLAFLIVMPLFAAVLLGRNAGLAFLAFAGAALAFCGYAAASGRAPATPHTPDALRLLFLSATFLTAVTVTVFVLIYERVVKGAMASLASANQQLQKQKDELAAGKEFLTTIMETVSDGIVAADASGRLSVFNRMAREFHGVGARPLESSDWAQEYNLYSADGQTVLTEKEVPLYRALQGENVTDFEFAILRPGAEKRCLISTASPLYNEKNEMIGAVATMHDVTTERRQQEEIRLQHLELTQFSRVASSDLQNPLQRIIDLSEALQAELKGPTERTARDDLRKIARNAEKMGVLIKDVLYMSRLPIGELSLQAVSTRECMEAAIDLSGLTEADCRFDFRFAQAPDVLADPHTLTNVFRNLILNASRVCGDADRRHIEFTCAVENGCLIAGVKDNGDGVTAEKAEHLFLPLERLHTEADQDGTGLALAISRKSVELMGGTIWVENEPDGGCHIRFRLPLAVKPQALAS